MATNNNSEWLSPPEAAAVLGIAMRTLRKWIAEGAVPAYRLNGKLIRIKRSDLDELMEPIPAGGR